MDGYSWFSHDHYNDEARQRLDRYDAIARRAQVIYDRLPRDRKDAFFELVLYPLQCEDLMNQKVVFADKSARHAAAGRASSAEYACKARAAAARIVELTDHYNTRLVVAGGKWNHIMSPAPGPWGNQFRQFDMPPLSDFAGVGPPTLDVAADLSVYTQGRRFIDLFNKGKGPSDWKATASQPWVKLDRTEGRFTSEQRLWVSIEWDRAPKGRDVKAAIDIAGNGGKRQIVVPVFNPAEPARDAAAGFVESHGCVSMEAEHFTRRRDHDGAGWRTIAGLGRSGDSVAVFPPTVASHTEPATIVARSPALEYDMYLFTAGEHQLHVDCLPTHPVAPDRGVRLAIGIDGSGPRVLGDRPRYPGGVLANLRRYTTTVTIDKPGRHTLTVGMVDPGVVIDKIVLYTEAPKDTYLGPPESFRGRASGNDE